MNRLYLLVGLSLGLVFLGLLTVNGALLGLAIPFVVYTGAALLRFPDAPHLSVTRRQSASRIAHGMPVEVTLNITNNGARLRQVCLADSVPPELGRIAGATRLLTAMAPGETVELSYTLEGRRGFYQFPGLEVEVSDPLGLVVRRAQVPPAGQLIVLPEIVRLRQMHIRPSRTRIYSGFIPARQGGPGVEFEGVRAYQPGDALRWVNARATARHEETLFVNEFEQERVAEVSLILDARLRSNIRSEQGSLFDYAVNATATLADAFLARGNRVGLLIYAPGIGWTFPGYGKVQRERILRALAQARTYDRQDITGFSLLSGRMFPAGSQIVVISPLHKADLDALIRLRAEGHQVLVISPDPLPFEQQALGPARQRGARSGTGRDVELAAALAGVERAVLFRKLRQAGIQVVDWNTDTPFYQVAHEALARRNAAAGLRSSRRF